MNDKPKEATVSTEAYMQLVDVLSIQIAEKVSIQIKYEELKKNNKELRKKLEAQEGKAE